MRQPSAGEAARDAAGWVGEAAHARDCTGGLEACGGERTECLGFRSRASQRPSPGGVFEDLMTAVTLFSRELCATVTIVTIRCSSGLVCSCHTGSGRLPHLKPSCG